MDIQNKSETSPNWIDLTNGHSVVWLDEQYHDPLQKYNIGSSKLRAIIDYLQCFTLIDVCVDFVEKMTGSTVFVIVSSFSCSSLLSRIHHLSQVHLIYIYKNHTTDVPDPNNLKTYEKIKCSTDDNVYQCLDDLFQQLSQDIRVFLRQHAEIDAAVPFTALPASEERTTGLHSRQQESWFPYLLEALQEIPPIPTGKEKFVAECRKLYQNNQSVLKFLKEFDETYVPQMAISWYTREGILYQLFNRTLRQLDQNRIFLFHFFIYDISQQLKGEHEKSKDANWRQEPLYRGQRMSRAEIDFLRESKTIYVNTFLSTTKSLDLAKIYAGTGSYPSNSDSLDQSVIFQIPALDWDRPEKNVAAIDHLSHFGKAEGEVLFSPSFLFWPYHVEYDEDEAVWNVLLCRYTEVYNLQYEYLNCLIRLDVILRTIIDEESSNDDFCTTIIDDIVSLVRQLDFDDDDILQLKLNIPTNDSQYELKILALFLSTPTPRIKRLIPSTTLSILYDCLATVFKCIEKYDLALANYTKATNYAENEQQIITVMRQVKIAQIHKITDKYPLAWEIFQEISTKNLIDNLSYENILNDIVVNTPPFKNEQTDIENHKNSYRFLNYIDQRANLQIYGSMIADNYQNFANYFLEHEDRLQTFECLNQEIKIRKRLLRHDKSMHLELADTCMSAAEVSTEDNPAQARKLYRQAIVHFKHCRNIGENARIAICWCEIGSLKAKHDGNIFLQAFDLLLLDVKQNSTVIVSENIARCYLCLAKSYARTNTMTLFALENCQLSLRFFLNGMPDDTDLIEEEFDGCWDLLLSLHQRKSDEDGSPVPTKEELYARWKTDAVHPELETKEIFEILRTTKQQLRKLKKSRRSNRKRSFSQ